ncbi:hypothetical protein K445DRAFT_305427, partial [Daldinia sp. EC12]
MDSYCYVPFGTEPECNQFRILTLLPGSGKQPLECLLEHGDIGKSPPYEAISYVWGDPRDKAGIICNGKPLDITAGLHTVLCHFRSASEKRSLWADAICINQNDSNERGSQVGRMKDIYSKADRVLIWLGEEKDESDRGIALFGKFRDKSEFPRLSAFARIIERLWFTRVWVVQELALATEAMV